MQAPSPLLRLVGRDYKGHNYSRAHTSEKDDEFLYTIELKV